MNGARELGTAAIGAPPFTRTVAVTFSATRIGPTAKELTFVNHTLNDEVGALALIAKSAAGHANTLTSPGGSNFVEQLLDGFESPSTLTHVLISMTSPALRLVVPCVHFKTKLVYLCEASVTL